MGRTGIVIIGSNFGDEGKGLITDFEVRRASASIVARFNGGAQAGHTVVTPTQRHVFGHIGAGTFAGAQTYFGPKFIVNPFVYHTEVKTLMDSMGRLDVSSSQKARVSTLYDMAINTLVELKRGAARHGSCGMGINETVTRHEFYPITMGDLEIMRPVQLNSMLADIRDIWVPSRLQELGITEVPEPYASLFTADPSHQAETMLETEIDTHMCIQGGNVVFEGAQGLALDEFIGTFPHVTRSITGLPYAIVTAAELGVSELEVVYVTRSYLTRHGAGPLEREGEYFGGVVEDKTNVDNQWQGSLRFAPLNVPMLRKNIEHDIARGFFVAQAHGIKLKEPTLAITCLDHIKDRVFLADGDCSTISMERDALPGYLASALKMHVSHVSYGPESSHVQYFSPV